MKNTIRCDICIIGGGASGLVAAVRAAEINPEASIVVLEKLSDVGRKVAASGNGRCNLSNVKSPEWERTWAFFSSLGLVTRTDSEGRIYPYSEDGRDVVSILRRACDERSVHVITRREVVGISSAPFTVETKFNKPKAYRSIGETFDDELLSGIVIDEDFDVCAEKVLIAAGGKSKPALGTTGDGYKFAKELGHSITPLIPVLTGVEVQEAKAANASAASAIGFSDDLPGTRQKGRISLYRKSGDAEPDQRDCDECDDKRTLIFQEDGEIQFTEYGISGICVFNMTRFIEGKDFSEYEVEIDFAPGLASKDLEKIIEEKKSGDNASRSNALSSIVKEPLAEYIESQARSSNQDKDSHKGLAERVKKLTLHPSGLRGWDMAQVTRGGVPIEEIDEATCESKIVPGLFITGEVLDRDYMCGGFNLQNAWTTGLKAGEAMGKPTSK